jgi:hypothetical protein
MLNYRQLIGGSRSEVITVVTHPIMPFLVGKVIDQLLFVTIDFRHIQSQGRANNNLSNPGILK